MSDMMDAEHMDDMAMLSSAMGDMSMESGGGGRSGRMPRSRHHDEMPSHMHLPRGARHYVERERDDSEFDNTNLYVKGLWKDCTQVELDDLFKIFGVIQQSRVYGDGVGFVRYEKGDSAKRAIAELHQKKVDSRVGDVLLVKFAYRKTRNPKRLIRVGTDEVEMIMNKNTNNVYLRCLPRTFVEQDLQNLCKPYGELTCTRMRESGVAFVRFRQPEDAATAIRELNGKQLPQHGPDDEPLLAKLANSDPFQPKIGFRQSGSEMYPDDTSYDRDMTRTIVAAMERSGARVEDYAFPSRSRGGGGGGGGRGRRRGGFGGRGGRGGKRDYRRGGGGGSEKYSDASTDGGPSPSKYTAPPATGYDYYGGADMGGAAGYDPSVYGAYGMYGADPYSSFYAMNPYAMYGGAAAGSAIPTASSSYDPSMGSSMMYPFAAGTGTSSMPLPDAMGMTTAGAMSELYDSYAATMAGATPTGPTGGAVPPAVKTDKRKIPGVKSGSGSSSSLEATKVDVPGGMTPGGMDDLFTPRDGATFAFPTSGLFTPSITTPGAAAKPATAFLFPGMDSAAASAGLFTPQTPAETYTYDGKRMGPQTPALLRSSTPSGELGKKDGDSSGQTASVSATESPRKAMSMSRSGSGMGIPGVVTGGLMTPGATYGMRSPGGADLAAGLFSPDGGFAGITPASMGGYGMAAGWSGAGGASPVKHKEAGEAMTPFGVRAKVADQIYGIAESEFGPKAPKLTGMFLSKHNEEECSKLLADRSALNEEFSRLASMLSGALPRTGAGSTVVKITPPSGAPAAVATM